MIWSILIAGIIFVVFGLVMIFYSKNKEKKIIFYLLGILLLIIGIIFIVLEFLGSPIYAD